MLTVSDAEGLDEVGYILLGKPNWLDGEAAVEVQVKVLVLAGVLAQMGALEQNSRKTARPYPAGETDQNVDSLTCWI